MLVLLFSLILQAATEDQVDPRRFQQQQQQRQSFGSNLADPYYAFNPDYMGGNRPNIQFNQNGPNRPGVCTCTCGDVPFAPPITCTNAQTCVNHCLQMYPGQCTLVNTYGCCGTSCQFFQSQSLDTRYCTCNCAGQQFLHSDETCTSPDICLTKCLMKFPQMCTSMNTQACCGQDCQSYSQKVSQACACQCQGKTFYPSPTCSNAEGCISTCMTTYSECTATETQGCCGQSCSSYIPTCSCSCGPNFRTTTSIPCQNGQSCVDTCIRSYGACNQENTQACCGMDCLNAYPTCSCLCGGVVQMTFPFPCGSSDQCAQACLRANTRCDLLNTQACCGTDCSGYQPNCRCQCGMNVYYTSVGCMNAEQCTNACISRYGHSCFASNTVGCCNETLCTRQNRFVGISQMSLHRFSSTIIISSSLICLIFRI